ncbi:TerB family tellurite resistance protein [Oceanimonas pelagia]|uniref:TerB family tellurite resistance protein n=1 Tax=Oceanimonas pelagia TaxID=3028314 RepID=A0AA50KQJ9_9GAMM|nr:TerB family tellurite resistance protein [Oceanimonas pelagia]WMC12165.1 TerB family tellurite resistance protein [Oceanimonas pelagia]
MMIKRLKQWLTLVPREQVLPPEQEVAVAALLSEVMMADGEAGDDESARLEVLLGRLFNQPREQVHEWLQQGRAKQEEAVSLYEFTSRLKALPVTEREAILLALWHMALADGRLDPQEEAIVRQVADLLYIPHSRFIWLKHRAEGELDGE